MTELELKIKEAAQKYYDNGTSDLTDAEFDALVDELRSTNPDSELLKTGWGYEVKSTEGQKVKHKYGHIGSLPKCRHLDELIKELKTCDCDVSLKLDGISIVLYYVEGKLINALTRGDGEVGIDVTEKVLKIDPIYASAPNNFTGAIRGEILMSYDNFNRYKANHAEAKNPRNSVAGLVGLKQLEQNDADLMSTIVYTIVGDESNTLQSDTMIFQIRYLLETWFDEEHVVPNTGAFQFYDATEETFVDLMNKLHDKWYGKYPADGIVITRKELSFDGYECGYIGQAYKFPPEEAISEVTGINWELSKTQYLIPVVQIKPVELAGTTVQNCSGFNAQYIKDNHIGAGSYVAVSKHGEIIPNIDRVVSTTHAELPDCCPVCGQQLVWQGVHLACNNPECPNAVEQDTLIWLENLAPIDGVGDLLRVKYLHQILGYDISIEQVMTKVPTIALWGLTESAQGKLIYQMFDKLFNSTFSFKSALLALNIPRLGDITADKIANDPDMYNSLIYYALGTAEFPEYKLKSIVGEATTKSMFVNSDKLKRLRFIAEHVDRPVTANVEFKGTVAITGKLSVSRDKFEEELKNAGYKVGEMNKNTMCLITDNPNSGSSKNAKADKLHIPKLTEAEFRQQYM